MLQPVVQAVCICDCIYNPLLMLFVCWSGVYSCWAIEWRMRQVGQTIRTGETRNKHTFVIRKLLGLGPQYTHIRTHIYTHTHTHTHISEDSIKTNASRTAENYWGLANRATTHRVPQKPGEFRSNYVVLHNKQSGTHKFSTERIPTVKIYKTQRHSRPK